MNLATDSTHQESFRKWHRILPYSKNIDFTGHEDLIAQLVELVASLKTGHRRVALSGFGGTGYVFAFLPEDIRSLIQCRKTQIALEYAYRQFNLECHIFWVYGKSQGTFSRDYQDISTRLKLPRFSDKEDELLLGVKRWFESDESGKWLLVLDNADNPSEFQGNQRGISRYLPQGSKGTLIVTTRSNAIANRLGCKTIGVAKMKPKEAEDLFRQLHNGSIEPADTNAIHELLRALDYLPLAIAAATTYMKETGTLPTEYLEILNSTRTNQAGLLMKKFYDIRRELQEDGTESADSKEDMTESVLSTYYITFRRIQELCPLAANLLQLIAFWDSRAIPELFLTESELDGAKDLLLFNEARGYLFDYALISRSTIPKTYDIHRLVHLSMETYASQNLDKAVNWKKRALDIVSRLFSPGDYKELATCTVYLSHVLAVLRHADGSETNSLKLFDNLAMYFFITGQYHKALEWDLRALDAREKILERDHPSTLTTVHNIASVFNKQGEHIKALEWYQRALDGWEKILGRDHPSTLTTVHNIALVFDSQGEHIKALEWYQRALDGYEKILGREHPSTLTTVHNIALVFDSQGEHIKALEWYQRALDGSEKILRRDHPSTLTTVHSMALVFDKQGEHIKALEWYQRALDGREKILGRDHPSTLSTVIGMALLFNKQGEHIKALEWYQRALDGREKILGRDHPSTLTTVSCMALVFDNQGEHIKALEWYQRALDGYEKILGREHPSTLTTVHSIALVFDKQGEHIKALEWYQRALDGREKILGRDHPSTLTTVICMALVFDSQGEHIKALEWFQRALDGYEMIVGRDHPYTLATVRDMASVWNYLSTLASADINPQGGH